MAKRNKDPWAWKVEERDLNERLNLRYEPGQWGDILKGEWALILVRHLLQTHRRETFRVLDPFAGAPTYPLVPAAVERLTHIEGMRYLATQKAYLENGKLASTGLLVRDACLNAGREPFLQIFDSDRDRCSSWVGVPEAHELPLSSGEEAWKLENSWDFVLVDPYDFFEQGKAWLPDLAALATKCPVLVYLFNKSPRGGGLWNQYQQFRGALAKNMRAGNKWIVGRIPSDPILPRAFHEVLLLFPGTIPAALKKDLHEVTELLALGFGRKGCWEEAQ